MVKDTTLLSLCSLSLSMDSYHFAVDIVGGNEYSRHLVLMYVEELCVRCEHFSPSKWTETVCTMANVFIFRSQWGNFLVFSHWKYTRYTQPESVWFSPFKVYNTHSLSLHACTLLCCALRFFFLFVYPCIVCSHRGETGTSEWETVVCVCVNEHIWFLINSISIRRSRLCEVHIEPMLSYYLLNVENGFSPFVHCHSNAEKLSYCELQYAGEIWVGAII